MSSTSFTCHHRYVASRRQHTRPHGRIAFAFPPPKNLYSSKSRIRSSTYDHYENDGKMGIVLAGFLVAEMPIIRMALDEAGGNAIEMIVCSSDLLYTPVQQVFQEGSEPDWSSPIPPDWIDGGGWGQERVLLFQNIPQLNQLEIVQVLYDVGIPPIIHSMSLDMVDDTSQILGHVLGQAVQLRRDFNDEEPYIDFEEDEEDEESEDEDAYMVTDDHSAPDLQPLDFGVIDDIWENNRGSSY